MRVVNLMLFLLICIPMAIIALIVYITMGRPVLFKQSRPGLHGKLFMLYKFRTMRCGDHIPDHARLTKTGKWLRRWSLDELPQIINILKGDMNWVGPRPLLPEYLDLYSKEQARRHDVRPGITGWAQINGRNAITWEDKFKYDVWYVDHKSFLLNIKIVLLTSFKVLKRVGISQQGHVTADKFTGNPT